MLLTDIMPKEDWAKFEKELNARFNLDCTVYNPDGISFSGEHLFCNSLCPQIKKHPEALATICASGNQNFTAQAKASGKPVIDECDAAMVKITVPIFVGEEFLGTVGACGALPPEGEVETFLVEKTTGLDEEKILELAGDIGVLTPEGAEQITEYILGRLEQILTKAS
ncbi:MAG: PocR ligand-binding domain-containing protein [Desulfatibacillaceae bacterium]|nr:PocR ligand-binding domain-containing protein [Desulfatibacillaceae bacterium]